MSREVPSITVPDRIDGHAGDLLAVLVQQRQPKTGEHGRALEQGHGDVPPAGLCAGDHRLGDGARLGELALREICAPPDPTQRTAQVEVGHGASLSGHGAIEWLPA
jgi:hypothetical protein